MNGQNIFFKEIGGKFRYSAFLYASPPNSHSKGMPIIADITLILPSSQLLCTQDRYD